MRINLLRQLDDIQENCKLCTRRKNVNNSVSHTVTCKGCSTYAEISRIGKQLLAIKKERKPMAEKVVLEQDSYIVLKAQGKSDADIARQFGIKQPTLSYYKKKWAMNDIQPDTAEVKPIETKGIPIVKDTKTAEYEQLIKALRNDLLEAHNQLDTKDELLRKYENVNAACEDVENEIANIREEKDKLEGKYNSAITKQYHNDYLIENQKKRIEDLGKTLALYEKENKAMRALLQLWI